MFGRVVVANAYSSDNFMSRQLKGMKRIYERGSRRMGRASRGAALTGFTWSSFGVVEVGLRTKISDN